MSFLSILHIQDSGRGVQRLTFYAPFGKFLPKQRPDIRIFQPSSHTEGGYRVRKRPYLQKRNGFLSNLSGKSEGEQKKLGHKSPKTMEISTHVSNKGLKRIKNPLDQILQKEGVGNPWIGIKDIVIYPSHSKGKITLSSLNEFAKKPDHLNPSGSHFD